MHYYIISLNNEPIYQGTDRVKAISMLPPAFRNKEVYSVAEVEILKRDKIIITYTEPATQSKVAEDLYSGRSNTLPSMNIKTLEKIIELASLETSEHSK